jgi:Tfp pilus tip-associated adhesin PilY1
VDLTPVLRAEPGADEYWTKLPIQPSISASTDAVDTTKQTPLADALDAAYSYFYDYIYEFQCNGCPEKGDGWSQQAFGQTRCRGNYIILLTDGLESARFKSANPDYDAAAEVAGALYQKFVQTFVIGFGQDVLQTAGYKALNDIAKAGSPPTSQRNAYFPTTQTQLEQALKEIFQAILSDSFGRSNPVVVKSGNRFFRGYFDITGTGEWKGNLEARELNDQGEITNSFPADPTWSAGDKLKSNGSRKIYTWTADSANPASIVFSPATSALYSFVNPSGEDINGDSSVDNTDAVTVLNFTLDPGYSGGNYRGKRPADWKLGDIYHASPVVVGAPPAFYAGNNYPAFALAWKDREPVIYAGTNDGMLHAFKVSDGSEVFAIIPKNLLGKLKNLRSTHEFYVDGSPKAADIYSLTGSTWKTVIITGERGGGPYYFAVDVTDPLNPDYPKILWEWTDLKMGDAWAKPEIGKIKDGTDTRYVAFVTGGYSTSNNVSNSVYVIDIDTGTTLKEWTNLGSPDNKIPGGATAFSLNSDNYTSYVYFGDNEGKLWKVDVSDPDKTNWTCSVLYTPTASKRKPVFYPPAAVKNDAGKILVFFGSGDDFNILTPATSYFWEVWDNNGIGEILGANWPRQLDNQKVLSTPVVANNVVYFTTWDYSGGGQNCGAGEGFLYGVSVSTSKATGGADALVLLDAQGSPQSAVGFTSLGPGIPTKPIVTNGVIYTTSSVGARTITRKRFQGWATTNVKAWREVF